MWGKFFLWGAICSFFMGVGIIAQIVSTHSIPNISQYKAAENITSSYNAQRNNINSLMQKTAEQEGATWFLFLLAFVAGVLISFTPCVYPMIPITIGILQSQASRSLGRSFLTAFCYVFGISLVYAAMGYFSATAGVIFGQWMNNPWLIFFISLFFIYLAFAMFGFYEMYIPRFMQGHEHKVSGRGSLFKVFLFGLISGTAASPCLTPALAILLALVAKLASPVAGFLVLFVFALGMGSLLVVIGTFSNAITLLPRAGEWMLEVKRVMGFIMLGVVVYFIQPLINHDIVTNVLYGIITASAGMYYMIQKSRSNLFFAIGLFILLGVLAAAGLYVYKIVFKVA